MIIYIIILSSVTVIDILKKTTQYKLHANSCITNNPYVQNGLINNFAQ